MSKPLRQQHDFEEEKLQEDMSPKFQEFQEFNPNHAKLDELKFFARIALFGVLTVVTAFFLLVLNLAPLWAFIISGFLSLAISSALYVFLETIKH